MGGGGEDVCYFGESAVRFCGSEVAWFKSRRQKCRSSVIALRSGNSVARSPPTSSRSVVKIAVTSSVKREVAGSNPWPLSRRERRASQRSAMASKIRG